MTEWNQYRGLDLDRVKGLMKGRAFINLRNVYEPENMGEGLKEAMDWYVNDLVG